LNGGFGAQQELIAICVRTLGVLSKIRCFMVIIN
jgi:hypothetical protein